MRLRSYLRLRSYPVFRALLTRPTTLQTRNLRSEPPLQARHYRRLLLSARFARLYTHLLPQCKIVVT